MLSNVIYDHMKGVKGFQKGNKYWEVNNPKYGFKKGRVPENKGKPPEQQPRYKDGRSFKRGRDWEKQKNKCYKRDKYACVDCGRKQSDGWTIQCHHLVDYDKTQDNRLSNLITICIGCHAKRHKIGFKENNQYWKKRKKHVTPNGEYKNKSYG